MTSRIEKNKYNIYYLLGISHVWITIEVEVSSFFFINFGMQIF